MLTFKNATAFSLPLFISWVLLLNTPEAHADTVIADPASDTFGSNLVQHDITGVSAVFDQSMITFTVNFAGTIFAPSANNQRSVYGFIDIDTDRNSATGSRAWVNALSPNSLPAVSLGDEYWLDLFSEELQPGRVDVVNQNSNIVGTAPIIYGSNTFSVTVPLSLLGNSNGLMDYGVIAGTFAESTDRAPNGSASLASTAVPEPATWLLLAAGFIGLGTARFRRKGGA